MSELPRIRFAQSPLLLLAVATSVGILLGHHLGVAPRLTLGFGIIVSFSLEVLSIWLARSKKLVAASVTLATAFLLSGCILSLIENRSVSLNRISRMYEQGIIIEGDPVELTGTIDGQPEPAPEIGRASVGKECRSRWSPDHYR